MSDRLRPGPDADSKEVAKSPLERVQAAFRAVVVLKCIGDRIIDRKYDTAIKTRMKKYLDESKSPTMTYDSLIAAQYHMNGSAFDAFTEKVRAMQDLLPVEQISQVDELLQNMQEAGNKVTTRDTELLYQLLRRVLSDQFHQDEELVHAQEDRVRAHYNLSTDV